MTILMPICQRLNMLATSENPVMKSMTYDKDHTMNADAIQK